VRHQQGRGTGRGFLYSTVAAELRDRIKRGIYPPGWQIPTETELVRDFRVSTITVRRAIRELTLEGLVQGRRGAGVFVRERRRIVRALSDFTASLSDEIRQTGEEPGLQELALGVVPASADVAGRLGVRLGTRAYRHEKLVLAGGRAVGVDVSYLPLALGRRLGPRLAQEHIYPLLVEDGVAVDAIDITIEGDTLSERDGRLLGLPVRSPVLAIHYTPRGPNGRALLTGRVLSRTDRYVYAFRIRHWPRPAPGSSHA
jgi:GntR family transcriptional regulator